MTTEWKGDSSLGHGCSPLWEGSHHIIHVTYSISGSVCIVWYHCCHIGTSGRGLNRWLDTGGGRVYLSSHCLLSRCPGVTLSYRHAILPSRCPTVMLSCCQAVLPSHCPAVTLSYCHAVLPPRCPVTLSCRHADSLNPLAPIACLIMSVIHSSQ